MGVITERQIKRMIADQIARFAPQLKGYKVFLFGSRAVGQAGERSDFDLGVWGEQPLSTELFFAIEDALDRLPTLHKIEWVDFNRVSQESRREAMKHIEVLCG